MNENTEPTTNPLDDSLENLATIQNEVDASGEPVIKFFETIVRDKKGRNLIIINKDGKVAVSRYMDATQTHRANVLTICAALVADNKCPDQDLEKIRKFINFESDEDEFCS